MKVLFIGDIVGEVGKKITKRAIINLKKTHQFDLIIANGENIAERNGITEALFQELSFAGVDVVTMGNHTWDRKDIFQFIDQEPSLLRPANYPEGTPGRGYTIYDLGRAKIGVISLMGNVYISTLPSPFTMIDDLIKEMQSQDCPHIIVDLHGEATSEKIAFGWYVDGRVSAVIGTHTHVQTADEKILPKGSAYITDVGMTGPYESVLGVKVALSVNRFLTQLPTRFEQATGQGQFNGVILTLDDVSGLATTIERIQFVE